MASKYDDDGGGGGKYDDDDGKADGGGGGKVADEFGGGGGGEPASAILPPLVQAFCHHVMSKKFRSAVEKFLAGNCAPFQGVSESGTRRTFTFQNKTCV